MTSAITAQFLALLISSFHIHCGVSPLRLQYSWQAIPARKSVLAISHVALEPTRSQESRTQHVLATTGHEGGTVRFWTPPFTSGNSAVAVSSHHEGSVFTLASRGEYLLSGSFDRSATVLRICQIAKNDLVFTKIATLPEHTGWVRGVQIFSCEEGTFFLSIGCNLINVWQDCCGDDDGDNTAKRLARLDAGPSPEDPEDEAFRRHDILTISILENDSCAFILAGLVDGTLRAFDGRWGFWKNRRTPDGNYPYDNTGSCSKFDTDDDDKPFATVRAHAGRVTGLHTLPHKKDEFISVGHDGYWRLWRLDRNTSSFWKLAEGAIGDGSSGDTNGQDHDYRICSSILLEENSLILGTVVGEIYQVTFDMEDISNTQKNKTMERGDKGLLDYSAGELAFC